MARRRAPPCHSRQVAADRLDALVWADLCALLTDPGVLDAAVRRAQQGWLSRDERQARRQDLHRRRAEVERQIGRLVEASAAAVPSLEELRARRTALEERLATLGREEQQLLAAGVQDDQRQQLAGQVEAFRAHRPGAGAGDVCGTAGARRAAGRPRARRRPGGGGAVRDPAHRAGGTEGGIAITLSSRTTAASSNATPRCAASGPSPRPPASAQPSRSSASTSDRWSGRASASRWRTNAACSGSAGPPSWPNWPPPERQLGQFPAARDTRRQHLSSKF
jgi:hypothetical protein